MEGKDQPHPSTGQYQPPLKAAVLPFADDAEMVAAVRLTGPVDYVHPPRRRRIMVPAVLFVATCLATFWTGSLDWLPLVDGESFARAGRLFVQAWQHESATAAVGRFLGALPLDWRQGLTYMAAVMGILLMHEMGHFLMAVRYRIPASLPLFIPMPMLPFGTMGAVIRMQGSKADRRQLFDLGIAGPLAGLAVALPILCIGIVQLDTSRQLGSDFAFHNPLIFRLLIAQLHPEYATPEVIHFSQFNPFLMAGWVGMLVTGLNMLPIGQLDGGHVGYALLGRRFNTLARALLVTAIVLIVVTAQYHWVLMLVLVILIGADHPVTANDHARLGWPRRLLGWAAMTIPIFCVPLWGIVETM